MGASAGPDIVDTGLVLALDAADLSSFRGQAIDNMYHISNGGSANSSIWSMPMGGTATGTYTTSHSYGTWNGNTIFEVTVSAGTIPGGYESFRDCISSSLNSTYGTTRTLSAKVRMIKGTIANLGIHNGGGTGGGTYTTFNEYLVPKDVNIKDGWYLLDTGVSGSYPLGQCVGIGILSADIKFLVTELMVHNTSNSVRFTPTTRGTTVATGGGWADLTGKGNHGELVNGVRESSSNGGSLNFGGTNEYISVSNSTQLNPTSSISVSTWIKFTSALNSEREMIAEKHTSPNQGWWFAGQYNKVVWLVTTNSGSKYIDMTNNTTINANSVYNIVGTYDGSTGDLKVYVNGIDDGGTIVGSGTGLVNSSNPLYIGAAINWSPNYSANTMYNFQIYNRALSAAEVSQNFNMLRGRFGI